MKLEFTYGESVRLLVRVVSQWVNHAEFRMLMVLHDHIYSFDRENEESAIPFFPAPERDFWFLLRCRIKRTGHLKWTPDLGPGA
jgi:hypothetical protein